MYKLKLDENCPKIPLFRCGIHRTVESLVRFPFLNNKKRTVTKRYVDVDLLVSLIKAEQKKRTNLVGCCFFFIFSLAGWLARCDRQKQNNGQENYANSIQILFLRIFHLTLNVIGADTHTGARRHTNCLSNCSAKTFKLT